MKTIGLKIYNIKEEENKILDCDFDAIYKFEGKLDCYDIEKKLKEDIKFKKAVEETLKTKDLIYFVAIDSENIYHQAMIIKGEDEYFVDCMEWDFRCVVNVALGV